MKLTPLFAFIPLLIGDMNAQDKTPAVSGGELFLAKGDIREFLRRVDAATRSVQNAKYLAHTLSDSGSVGKMDVIIKRDRTITDPYNGKILLRIVASSNVCAFDGKYFRTQNMEWLSEPGAKAYINVFRDVWIHFLHPTPFQDEIESTVARFEGEQDVDGHRCSAVYVEYKTGGQARWFFDQISGLPRRVERLSLKDGRESVWSVTLAQLRVNEATPDQTFTVGEPALEFSESDARHLARIYAMTIPIAEGDFQAYLSQNRVYFVENGGAIRLARSFGLALIASGTASYDPTAEQRVAAAAAKSSAPPELTPHVAREMNKASLDLWQLGHELLWLAEVLPRALEGDMVPYRTTGTILRQKIREVLPILEDLLRDPEIRPIWENAIKQLGPLAEEYVMQLYRVYARSLKPR